MNDYFEFEEIEEATELTELQELKQRRKEIDKKMKAVLSEYGIENEKNSYCITRVFPGRYYLLPQK